MHTLIDAPTPAALADLVERCKQIDRYATQLTAAEESRISALAVGIVAMRNVLELPSVAAIRLPLRHGRMSHWTLTGSSVEDVETPAIKALEKEQAKLVLDEHGQVKILSDRNWRGAWRTVTLWKDGVHDLSAAALMEYLARLASLAQARAPAAAMELVERQAAIYATRPLTASGPRMSQNG
jgi:hypothetical protein